jgi:autotransporter-associated beta strand protein
MALLVLGLELLAGPGQAIATQPLGIDVSSYQGSSIDWSSVKGAGYTFAWAKATEGLDYIDADFTINEANAKAAGVYIGAYHYAHPELHVGTAGADAEAAYFWNEAKNYLIGGNGYLVPMLDFEVNTGTGASMSAWINEWCQDIKNYAAANGAVCNPVVYTEGSIASVLESPATDWPLNIADPGYTDPQGENPSVSLGPWSDWTFWQYSWTGSVPGVSGNCDEDIIDGSASTLQLFLITTSGTSAGAGVSLDWDPGAKKAAPGSGGTGNWDNGSAKWWLSGTGDVAWNAGGDYANFAGTNGTVTLTTGVSADSITFNTAGYVITGTSETLTLNSPANISVPAGSPTYLECVLAGEGYNLSGGGVLVLNNADNASGSGTSAEFIIGPGTTLVVNNDHAVGNSGVTLNLEAGGIYQNNDTTSGDQFLMSTVDASYDSAIALLSGGGIFDNPNASLTMSDYITGPGSLTFTGWTNSSGTPYVLTLTDTGNNYTGGTIVQGPGELKANAAGTLGATTNSLTVSGGILDLGGASHTAGAVTISGGTIQDGTLTGSSYAGQSGTVTAVLAGSGAMTQTTSGTLILRGVNTYSGGTTIGGGGVYCIAADSALGAAASSLTLNGGCLKNDNSAPTLASRTVTLGASGGYFDAGWAPSEPITLNGKITGAGPLYINLDGSPVVLANTGNNYTNNTIIGMNGPGYYSPGSAAWLKLGAANVLPHGSGYGDVCISNAWKGQLDMAGFSANINGLWGDGIVTNGSSTASTLTVGNNNVSSTFSGIIKAATGSIALTKTGTGTLTLSGANTYTGLTTINAGTLDGSVSGSIPGNVTVNSGILKLDNTSAMSSGATLTLASSPAAGAVNLNFYGTQTLSALYFGTTRKAAGTWAASGANHNNTAFTGSGILNVTTGPASITAVSLTSGSSPSTYGNSLTFTATVTGNSPGGTVQFKVDGVAVGSPVTLVGGSAPLVVSILSVSGSPHQITAYYSGDDNNNPSDSSASPFSQAVTAKSLTAGLTGTVSKTYDGTVAATLAAGNYSLPGVISGDTVTLNNPASGTYDTGNVGVGKTVSVTGLAISGSSATNYTLSSTSASAAIGTITAKLLNYTGISATNTVYNATNTASFYGTAATLTAEAPGTGSTTDGAPYTSDTVSFTTGTLTGTFASRNAGTNIAVTVTGGLSLTGAQSGNYSVGSPTTTLTVNITPKPLTVTGLSVPASKVYDGTTATATPSGTPTLLTAEAAGSGTGADGAPYIGDTVPINGSATGSYNDPNVASANTVTFSGLSTTNENYSITAPAQAATITALTTSCLLTSSLNPSGPGTNVTFTAAVNGVPPAADLPAGNIVFSANGAPFATNALANGNSSASTASLPLGTNTLTAQYLGNGNFLASTGSVAQVVNFSVTCSQTNALLSIADNLDGTITLTFVGTPQAAYYVLASADVAAPMASWVPVAGSTNTVTNVSGLWQCTVTNTAPQQFYRGTAVVPCP